MKSSQRIAAWMLIGTGVASHAPGQDESAAIPEASSGEAAPTSDQRPASRDLESRPVDAPRVRPVDPGAGRPPKPGVGGDGLRPAAGELVREGAFVRDRRGRLVASPEGRWIFVFDRDESGRAESPMFVQRCRRHDEMANIVEGRPDTPTFLVTGEVFVHERMNYLLPTFFSVLAEEHAAVEEAAAAEGAAAPGGADPSNSGVSGLLEQMGAGQARTPSRPPARSRGSAPREERAGAAAGEGPRLLREGVTIQNRRGRIVRKGADELAFVTDNGPDAKPSADPPLTLLPSLALERIRRLFESSGDALPVRISGTVTLSSNQNYLLVTMYVVDPDIDGNLVAGP